VNATAVSEGANIIPAAEPEGGGASLAAPLDEAAVLEERSGIDRP